MIGLLQAEWLVSLLPTPLHELVAVEAVVIPVKDPVSLDQSDGFVDLHDWPPGTVLYPSMLASRGDLRGVIGYILDLRQLAKREQRGCQQDSGRFSRTSEYASLIKPTALTTSPTLNEPLTLPSRNYNYSSHSFIFFIPSFSGI